MTERVAQPQELGRATFEAWGQALNQIYGSKNQRRSPSGMWLRAVSDASRVGEAVRRTDPTEAMESIAHTFGWIITTCNKLIREDCHGQPYLQHYDGTLQESLTSIVLSKYPDVCPYCWERPCHCAIYRRQREQESKQTRRKRQQEAYLKFSGSQRSASTINELAGMFDSIYGQVHYDISLEKITFHFLEEVGEVAHCLTSLMENSARNEDTVPFSVQLSEELADVTAWGFAIVGKLADLAKDSHRLSAVFLGVAMNDEDLMKFNKNDLLARWLERIFQAGNGKPPVCHTCHMSPCMCLNSDEPIADLP